MGIIWVINSRHTLLIVHDVELLQNTQDAISTDKSTIHLMSIDVFTKMQVKYLCFLGVYVFGDTIFK